MTLDSGPWPLKEITFETEHFYFPFVPFCFGIWGCWLHPLYFFRGDVKKIGQRHKISSVQNSYIYEKMKARIFI